MMIPEAWENHRHMDAGQAGLLPVPRRLMEPWDGPASIAFTDGTVIGAVLDRNGLRPSRYWVTDDGLVVMASEVGVLDIDPARVVQRGRLQPGRMFLVDTAQGRIVADEEIKSALAAEHPYAEWLARQADPLRRPAAPLHPDPAARVGRCPPAAVRLHHRGPQGPPGAHGRDRRSSRIGSMGTDTPLAVLSERPRLLYDYFQQLFAQVTNPPLDAIREELVTSLASTIGPERNLLAPEPASCNQIVMPRPVLTNEELAKLLYINEDGTQPGWRTFAIDGLFPARGSRARAGALRRGPRRRLRQGRAPPSTDGAKVIVLSDRHSSAELAPIPALLLVSAVHHHLIEKKTRTRVGLVVETGEAREVHHMALLLGYGAAAINPYLAFDTITELVGDGALSGLTPRQAIRNYVKACGKGVLKIMSKMGISTVASYTGAQVFEAIGLLERRRRRLLHRHGQPHRRDRPRRDRRRGARPPRPGLPGPARASWPTATSRWVASTSGGGRASTTCSTRPRCTSCSTRPGPGATTSSSSTPGRSTTSRPGWGRCGGCSGCGAAEEIGREPVPARRSRAGLGDRASGSRTGAMSYGSISAEAHETLAIAMNRLGGRSNTGEGGEDAERYRPRPQRRSAAQRHQAGGVGPVRRDQRVPGQRRRPPDQDGPGGQAGRGRPAPRPQGVPVDRQDPVLHARAWA